MKHARTLLGACVFVLAGCVPASTSAPSAPAGAGGFTTEPTPATRGEPFATDDGWTIRFEEIVLQATTLGTPGTPEQLNSGENSEYRWNARDRVQLYTPGLAAGPWHFVMYLFNSHDFLRDKEREVIDLGVDPKLSRRLIHPDPDEVESTFGGYWAALPAMLLVLRAEKQGRVVQVDVALAPDETEGPDLYAAPMIDVKANALTLRPLTVSVERLFLTTAGKRPTPEVEPGEPRYAFEPFADADADADGRLTIAELEAACPACGDTTDPDRPPTLYATLRARLPSIFVSR